MSNHTYGVNTANNGYVDVSTTERGAKSYATRNGYDEVWIRFNAGYHIALVAEKINGKWIKSNNDFIFHK